MVGCRRLPKALAFCILADIALESAIGAVKCLLVLRRKPKLLSMLQLISGAHGDLIKNG
jgi:hypothetical protein